jgi:hypothetical protein
MMKFQPSAVTEPFTTAPTPPLLGLRDCPLTRSPKKPTDRDLGHAGLPVVFQRWVKRTDYSFDFDVANDGRFGDIDQVEFCFLSASGADVCKESPLAISNRRDAPVLPPCPRFVGMPSLRPSSQCLYQFMLNLGALYNFVWVTDNFAGLLSPTLWAGTEEARWTSVNSLALPWA